MEEKRSKVVPAMRVGIVPIRIIKDSSIMYEGRNMRSADDGYKLFKQFLENLDREYMVVIVLDT